jgi:hypothetical protein
MPNPVVAYLLRDRMTERGELYQGPGHDRVSLRRSFGTDRLADRRLMQNKSLLGLKRVPTSKAQKSWNGGESNGQWPGLTPGPLEWNDIRNCNRVRNCDPLESDTVKNWVMTRDRKQRHQFITKLGHGSPSDP